MTTTLIDLVRESVAPRVGSAAAGVYAAIASPMALAALIVRVIS